MTTPTREQIITQLQQLIEDVAFSSDATEAAADAILALFAGQVARVAELEPALSRLTLESIKPIPGNVLPAVQDYRHAAGCTWRHYQGSPCNCGIDGGKSHD